MARTLLFDQQLAAHIKAHPNCSVINLACGLDDRFRRVDNGKIHWYNVDLEDVIDLRKKLIQGNERVKDIPSSVFDYRWMDQIENKDHAVIVAEGFLMYPGKEEIKELFDTVAKSFTNTLLLVELMTQWMVDYQSVHDTTKKTNVTFQYGVDKTEDFCKLCSQYKMVGEYNFTDAMKHVAPVRMTFIAPILRSKNNRLECFIQK